MNAPDFPFCFSWWSLHLAQGGAALYSLISPSSFVLLSFYEVVYTSDWTLTREAAIALFPGPLFHCDSWPHQQQACKWGVCCYHVLQAVTSNVELQNTYTINTFKYHVSCTDGKISVGIIYFYSLFFHRHPSHRLCFLSCRPFVVNVTFPTGLVQDRKENTTCEWDDGGKIGNKNK